MRSKPAEPVTATFARPRDQTDAKPQTYFEDNAHVAKGERLLTSTESDIQDSGFAKPSMQAFPALDISGIENDPMMRKGSNLVVGTPFGEAEHEILENLFPGRDASSKQFEAVKKFDLTDNDDSPQSNSAPNFDDIFANGSGQDSPQAASPKVNLEEYQTP